jgi:hypothetical protein
MALCAVKERLVREGTAQTPRVCETFGVLFVHTTSVRAALPVLRDFDKWRVRDAESPTSAPTQTRGH